MNQSLARASFSPSFVEFLSDAPMSEIEDAYCEAYKDAHGIKARWIYGMGFSREDFARMFDGLGEEIKEANAREDAYQARFRGRCEQLGLGDWLASKGITTTYDLMDLESCQEWMADKVPEPFPYELLAVRAGWGEPGRMVTI